MRRQPYYPRHPRHHGGPLRPPIAPRRPSVVRIPADGGVPPQLRVGDDFGRPYPALQSRQDIPADDLEWVRQAHSEWEDAWGFSRISAAPQPEDLNPVAIEEHFTPSLEEYDSGHTRCSCGAECEVLTSVSDSPMAGGGWGPVPIQAVVCPAAPNDPGPQLPEYWAPAVDALTDQGYGQSEARRTVARAINAGCPGLAEFLDQL